MHNRSTTVLGAALLLGCSSSSTDDAADGNAPWSVQHELLGPRLESVQLPTSEAGFTVGGTCSITQGTCSSGLLSSSDGGDSWSAPGALPTDVALHSLSFLDAHTGWIAGETLDGSGVILHTIDGGLGWSEQTPASAPGLLALQLVTSDAGWAAGYGGWIVHTVDGGQSWAQQATDTMLSIYALDFVDTERGWAAATCHTSGEGCVVGGGILGTSDGGVTWTVQAEGLAHDLRAVSAIDDQRAWAVGGAAYATDDGGASWKERSVGELVDDDGYPWVVDLFTDVQFLDSATGWLTVLAKPVIDGSPGQTQGNVLRTDDGGSSWRVSMTWDEIRMSGSSLGSGLIGIDFIDATTGVAVGENGLILKTVTGGT